MTNGTPLQLLYCDESNLQEKSGDFLLYGGLIVSSAILQEFSAEIDKLRSQFGIPRDYKLKFNPAPPHFSHERFIELKESIINLAVKFKAYLIIYAVLHDIAKDSDEARRNGINTVCFHFDCILIRLKGIGLVLIDRFNDQGNKIDAHLVDKFMIGVTDMPFSKEMRLNRILGFHYSAIGQSHFPSVVDILLGSVRFSFNTLTRNEEGNVKTARKLINALCPLFFRENNSPKIPEISFLLSPKTVKIYAYRAGYQNLISFLRDCGLEIEQKFE